MSALPIDMWKHHILPHCTLVRMLTLGATCTDMRRVCIEHAQDDCDNLMRPARVRRGAPPWTSYTDKSLHYWCLFFVNIVRFSPSIREFLDETQLAVPLLEWLGRPLFKRVFHQFHTSLLPDKPCTHELEYFCDAVGVLRHVNIVPGVLWMAAGANGNPSLCALWFLAAQRPELIPAALMQDQLTLLWKITKEHAIVRAWITQYAPV